MRAVIQRVTDAKVTVDKKTIGEIANGLCVFLGVGKDDTEVDLKFIAEKIVNLRIFSDDNDKMNLSLKDVDGEILLISQFTLYGDCSRGRRPYFGDAMSPDGANEMYEQMSTMLRETGVNVQTGVFGADMQVTLTNDGPVTIILESKK